MTPIPVAHPWFRAEDAGAGVTRLWEPYIDDLLESNVWHVPGADVDLVVDAANGVGPIRPSIDALAGDRTLLAVATHGHFDHVGGLDEFEDRRVHAADDAMTRDPFPLRLRREDVPPETFEMYAYYGYQVPDVLVEALPEPDFDLAGWVSPGARPTGGVDEGDVLDLGDRRFTVLHTPGHTAGSVCLFEERTGLLFSGDAVYVDDALSWDDAEAMVASLTRLRDLAGDVARVCAGHGRAFDGDELASTAGDWIGRIEQIERGETG
jgi:glyoxylase-like metal-dependent hydrolase (beta-lactamase superfamily II)